MDKYPAMRVFVRIAEAGNLWPPAPTWVFPDLSQRQLMALEAALGIPLIDRRAVSH